MQSKTGETLVWHRRTDNAARLRKNASLEATAEALVADAASAAKNRSDFVTWDRENYDLSEAANRSSTRSALYDKAVVLAAGAYHVAKHAGVELPPCVKAITRHERGY